VGILLARQQLQSAAVQNLLFDKYFKFVEETEPPLVFHRWSMLTSVGALLGRQYYLPFGEFNIVPTQYVMLIGDPGTRKSTAIKLAKKILANSGYEKFAAPKTSKEKFLLDLEGIEDDSGTIIDTNKVMANLFGDEHVHSDPREVYVVADEFNEFVGSGNLEFLSLLGSLWDWDDPSAPFKQRLKTSRSVSIYQPTLSILGGNTHTGFAEAFPPQSIGQGFLSRLLLIYGESSGKKIAFPTAPSPLIRQELIDLLQSIKTEVLGEATFTKRAKEMIEVIYRTYPGIDDARFRHYNTRRHTHLLKLCMLAAACNLRTEIGPEEVLFANTLLTFTEHKMPLALGEFGKSRNADVAARIISLLTEADTPLGVTEIWKHVQTELEKIEDLNKLLAGMLQGNKIQHVTGAKNSGVIGYMIVKKRLDTRLVYVDYSLLKEANHGKPI
jgi:hypothetical protein